MQDRRGVLSQLLARVSGAKPQGQGQRVEDMKPMEDMKPTILADVLEALTSEELEGVEKRNLLSRVVDKMICHRLLSRPQRMPSRAASGPDSIRRRFPARAGGIADDQ